MDTKQPETTDPIQQFLDATLALAKWTNAARFDRALRGERGEIAWALVTCALVAVRLDPSLLPMTMLRVTLTPDSDAGHWGRSRRVLHEVDRAAMDVRPPGAPDAAEAIAQAVEAGRSGNA